MGRRLGRLVEQILANFGLAVLPWCRHHWHRDEAPRGWHVPYWRCCWCGGEQIGRPPAYAPPSERRACRNPGGA